MSFHYLFKIVVVGHEKAGKTTFIDAFLKNKFKPVYSKTTLAELYTSTVNAFLKTFKLHIWDTPGTKEDEMLTRSYFPVTAGAIVVFDLTDASSWTRAQELVAQLREEVGITLTIVLFGTKSDLPKRAVKGLECRDYAEENNILYFEGSGKNQNNVYAAFKRLTEEIFKRIELGVLDPYDPESGVKVGALQLE